MAGKINHHQWREVYCNSVVLIFNDIGKCIFFKLLEKFVLFFVYFCGTRDQTQDFMHTKQVLYHWGTSLALGFLFIKGKNALLKNTIVAFFDFCL